MPDTESKLKSEAWAWLGPVQTVHLATWDGTSPRVRPVSLIFDDGRFWLCTGSADAKVRQLEQDPGFEFSLMLEKGDFSGTLRCSGRARIAADPEEKSRMSARIPFFGQYWESPEDPSYCLVELHVKDVEFMRPGEMTSTRFKV
ncbi:MAG: pyridoxamine 5'-phosphate oxidase family protein [Candidatus Fermentibacteraceae bacterium]|nr:pyridoxamine 5'-phosphate oxidase family protein [Candidatus Fermentibacteraceae bacterium]MBN2607742.1 pyridoxamine 5'-phosphate oxidase family protein [Candidatus Fermentibacteraceae bacterium]